MKRLALALLLSSFAIGGAVADPTCHDRAAEKKLVGAALTSFMKKCESMPRRSAIARPPTRSYRARPKPASLRNA